jgi:hypothetical protein
MKKPIIKDVEIRRYVEHLESKIKAINTQSLKAETYLSLRNFIKNNNSILKNTNITEEDASNKDDKLMERAFKYADSIWKYLETADKIYDSLGETYVEEVDREEASVYEKAINGK